MPDAIKPTSVEGYLIRVYDQVEVLNGRVLVIETRLSDLMASETATTKECEERLDRLESRVIHGESSNKGVKDFKDSMAPYIIAFISCALTVLSYIFMHSMGIK